VSQMNPNSGLNRDANIAALWKNPDFDAAFRYERRKRLVHEFGKENAGAAEQSAYRPWINSYFAKDGKRTIRRGDPSFTLPKFSSFAEQLEFARHWGAEDFRLEQAKALANLGSEKSARRLAVCGILAKRKDCRGSCRTKYFDRFGCNLRYCTVCGENGFRKLFSRYMGLESSAKTIIERVRQQGRTPVTAKLDFTAPSDGKMPSKAEMKKFHRDLWRFRRALEQQVGLSRKDYGIAGCDEFGGKKTAEHPTGNWNLHRHCVYVGPYLPQKRRELSALWSIVALRGARYREAMRFARKHGLAAVWVARLSRDGFELAKWERRFASIKSARSFAQALGHALKYPAKFLSNSSPRRLAELETVFQGLRRVSASGAFYNVKLEEDAAKKQHRGKCPKCDGQLVSYTLENGGGFVVASALEKEGRIDLAVARKEQSRKKVFSHGVRSP
jgi:hypothetical protein